VWYAASEKIAYAGEEKKVYPTFCKLVVGLGLTLQGWCMVLSLKPGIVISPHSKLC